MPELETMIAQWRDRMSTALSQRDEVVAELEEHLREHIATLQRQGKSDEEAFAIAQERLGEPGAVAREFERMGAGWLLGMILLSGLALLFAFTSAYLLWNWSRRLPLTALQIRV